MKSKKDMWKACLANGYYMPAEKCSINTSAFLREVREKTCFMIKLADIKPLPCPYPPPNDQIQKALCSMIQNCDYEGDEKSKQSYFRLNFYLEKYQAD